ncbi:retrovirus-related pol polyprotein from transposon TNT 1-94 [Tanacetum coccineum]
MFVVHCNKSLVFALFILIGLVMCDGLVNVNIPHQEPKRLNANHRKGMETSSTDCSMVSGFSITWLYGDYNWVPLSSLGLYLYGTQANILSRTVYVMVVSKLSFPSSIHVTSATLQCLLVIKSSSTKSWLWHRRLNHLNFGTLNELTRNNLVRGLPMLKYAKDHFCPSCQLGHSKDGLECWYSHGNERTSRSPQQNGVCRKDGKHELLLEAARYMIIFAKSFHCSMWAEVVATGVILLIVQKSNLLLLQSGRSRSALVKDPEPPSVPPTKKQVDDLFQWFDDDEVVPITPVNVPAAPAPENAIGSPSTTVISEGAPAVTESLLPHQVPLPDTSDSDDETLFDHVDSNVFDTYNAPETASEASSSNSVNIDVTPNNQLPHVQKWTQAHPLENIIGDKDRPVSTYGKQ